MPKPYDTDDARFDAEQQGKCPRCLQDGCGCSSEHCEQCDGKLEDGYCRKCNYPEHLGHI